MNDKPILQAIDLHKSFGKNLAKTKVLRGLNLSANAGEFLAIMGPSGCGKSTLLNLLGLMSYPDVGKIQIGDKLAVEIDKSGKKIASNKIRQNLRRNEIGFVFQRFNLLGQLTGRDNIRISLKVRRLKDFTTADQLIKKLHLEDCQNRKPSQMSIGQQQRFAVVRALAHKPAILLADEPTGNLDSQASDELLNIFRTINQEQNQTIIMITHSQEAASRADRILRMRDGVIRD